MMNLLLIALVATCLTTEPGITDYQFCLGPQSTSVVCAAPQPGNSYEFQKTSNETYINCQVKRGTSEWSDPSNTLGPYQSKPVTPGLIVKPSVGE